MVRTVTLQSKKHNLKGKSLATALMSDTKFDITDMSEVIMAKSYVVGTSFKLVDFSKEIIGQVNLGKLICMV